MAMGRLGGIKVNLLSGSKTLTITFHCFRFVNRFTCHSGGEVFDLPLPFDAVYGEVPGKTCTEVGI